MIEITLWITMLMNQWIPGPVLIPHPTVYAPRRILRCVECATWPVRVKN